MLGFRLMWNILIGNEFIGKLCKNFIFKLNKYFELGGKILEIDFKNLFTYIVYKIYKAIVHDSW